MANVQSLPIVHVFISFFEQASVLVIPQSFNKILPGNQLNPYTTAFISILTVFGFVKFLASVNQLLR